MDLFQSQSQEQRQIQRLFPAMRQSLEILQLPTGDLWELVRRECEKNPTIEVEGGECFVGSGRRGAEEADVRRKFLENLEGGESLEEHLLRQVPDWSDGHKRILSKILESVDGRGFLDGDLRRMARELAVPIDEVRRVHGALKSLHPAGIGAENLQECLLLQLEELGDGDTVAMAKVLVERHFPDLRQGKIDCLCKKLHLAREKIIAAGKLVARLNFSPISGFSNERTVAIVPDLRIFKENLEWTVALVNDRIPTVRFSKLYREISCSGQSVDGKTWQYLKRQARSGATLVEAIARRQSTLLAIGKVIATTQVDFLENGPGFMRPLLLADAAARTNLHVSTVSRAIRGKYVATPQGTHGMATFFGGGPPGTLARSAILERIRTILAEGGGKLTDGEIAIRLSREGITIARRTVAKYRAAMNLPNSHQTSRAGARRW